jgi:ferredoxin--NADP+ reductase
VAVVGAGPAGFFSADSLLKREGLNVSVDLVNRFPTPFGLVRDGVAPDHQKIKSVTRSFERTASDPRVRYFGNVTFGVDVSREDLRAHYDQIVYAVGAPSDRRMGIPGEDLAGSLPATAFVAWYNGHPEFVDLAPDLSVRRVVVVGNGNVAVDVTRILVRPVADLETTDIADHALRALRSSRVEEVVVLGRRGPVQAAFTTPELRELGELGGVDVEVDPRDLDLDPESAAALEGNQTATRNLERLRDFAAREPRSGHRRIVLRFLTSPVEVLSDGSGRVKGVRIEKNELVRRQDGTMRPRGTGEYETLECGMILRSVGYRCVPLAGVPFDEVRGVIANSGGRVTEGPQGPIALGEYVVGWAKRGPSGVIGTNKADAADTVDRMVEDLAEVRPVSGDAWRPEAAEALLRSRVSSLVDWEGWQRLDREERMRGEAQGRPRDKICRVEEMISVACP